MAYFTDYFDPAAFDASEPVPRTGEFTRLGVGATPTRLYGDFERAQYSERPAGQVTRLGLCGVPARLYGDFARAVEVVAEERPSGGWAASNYRDLERRRKRRRELEELEEETDRLEALLIAEKALPPNPTVEAKVTVREYAAKAQDFSRRTQRAIDYAKRAKTDLAYQLAAREIAQQLEDEELAIVTFIAHYA